MCRPVKCRSCGKTTWQGCGAHIDQVMSQIKKEDRCICEPPSRKKFLFFSDFNKLIFREFFMKKNVQIVDRVVRVLGGLFLSSMAFWGPSNYWFLLGSIFVVTGLVGSCPIYSICRISTAPKEK